MSIPAERDWGDYTSDLDQKPAHDMFAGRSNEEMQPFFKRNVIERTDELRWMPETPFRYYMVGFRDFVMARDFDPNWASDSASCFLELVEEKLNKQPHYILPIMSELMKTVRFVAQNQQLYEVEEKIYGNFQAAQARIESLYAQSRGL